MTFYFGLGFVYLYDPPGKIIHRKTWGNESGEPRIGRDKCVIIFSGCSFEQRDYSNVMMVP